MSKHYFFISIQNVVTIYQKIGNRVEEIPSAIKYSIEEEEFWSWFENNIGALEGHNAYFLADETMSIPMEFQSCESTYSYSLLQVALKQVFQETAVLLHREDEMPVTLYSEQKETQSLYLLYPLEAENEPVEEVEEVEELEELEELEEVELDDIQRYISEKREKWKEFTQDKKSLDAVDCVAFHDEDVLFYLIHGFKEIYLYGDCFSIPLSPTYFGDVKYIGLNSPTVHLSPKNMEFSCVDDYSSCFQWVTLDVNQQYDSKIMNFLDTVCFLLDDEPFELNRRNPETKSDFNIYLGSFHIIVTVEHRRGALLFQWSFGIYEPFLDLLWIPYADLTEEYFSWEDVLLEELSFQFELLKDDPICSQFKGLATLDAFDTYFISSTALEHSDEFLQHLW